MKNADSFNGVIEDRRISYGRILEHYFFYVATFSKMVKKEIASPRKKSRHLKLLLKSVLRFQPFRFLAGFFLPMFRLDVWRLFENSKSAEYIDDENVFSILELGSGHGYISSYIKSRYETASYFPVDIDFNELLGYFPYGLLGPFFCQVPRASS